MIFLYDQIPGQEGRTLRNRVIRRVIPTLSYFPWQKAFEATDFWQHAGFDYVPIEPIVQVRQENGTDLWVAVDARVLPGISVKEWKKRNGALHMQAINDSIKRIQIGFRDLGIGHGHFHGGNVVLVSNRDSDNVPDPTKPPRAYAIDFDQSVDLAA